MIFAHVLQYSFFILLLSLSGSARVSVAGPSASRTRSPVPSPTPDRTLTCKSGPVECCQNVVPASDPAASTIISQLGITLRHPDVDVGLSCTNLTDISEQSSEWYVHRQWWSASGAYCDPSWPIATPLLCAASTTTFVSGLFPTVLVLLHKTDYVPRGCYFTELYSCGHWTMNFFLITNYVSSSFLFGLPVDFS